MTKSREAQPWDFSRRGFLQAAGLSLPAVSMLLQDASAAVPPEQASAAQDIVAKDMSDPALNHLTFDEVQRTGHEVHYEEIARLYGGPMSLAPVISVRLHPEVVWLRPDLGIGMIANPVLFGVGATPKVLDWRNMERSLRKGHLPIISSVARDDVFAYRQTAFAVLLSDKEVVTGHEKQVAMFQMNITNTDPTETQTATLWAYVPAEIPLPHSVGMYGPFGNYHLYQGLASLPTEEIPDPATDNVLRDGDTNLGVFELGSGVTARRYKKLIRLDAQLFPGQTKSVVLKISTNKKGLNSDELGKLQNLEFFTALDRRELELEQILNRGMRLNVPEAAINNIYKAQLLYNQAHIVQAADRDFFMPVDSFVGVWPWSHMKQANAMDEYGYHDDVTKMLGYFLKLQGKRPPNGMHVTSYEGVFPSSATFDESGWDHDPDSTIYGRIAALMADKIPEFPNWANNTGCILFALGEHYFYTGDQPWLESVAPAMIKACDWIIAQRQQTKTRDANGQKVLQYGLMPAGQPYDASAAQTQPYYFCFTDGFIYKGFKRAVEALSDIHHPESQRLANELRDYHEDIKEVMRRTLRTDPNLPPFPEQLYGPDGWAVWSTAGINLVEAGLLDPEDPIFAHLEDYMKKHFNADVLGLTGRCRSENEKIHGQSYYVIQSDNLYHWAYAVRGDVEKSLLVFYSALGIGLDKQSLCAVERILLYERRYAPFSVNTPHGAEVCTMVRRTLILQRDGVLMLLPVTPRRWLEAGKKIVVENAPTYFGSLDLSVNSELDQQKIVVELTLRIDRRDKVGKIRLRIPHPSRTPMLDVLVNNAAWTGFNKEKEVIELQPDQEKYEIVVRYSPAA